eukprot:1599637-Prymnesium_polylepis.1
MKQSVAAATTGARFPSTCTPPTGHILIIRSWNACCLLLLACFASQGDADKTVDKQVLLPILERWQSMHRLQPHGTKHGTVGFEVTETLGDLLDTHFGPSPNES